MLDINKNQFYDEYIELLINRVTHSTMSLEKDLGNPDDSKNAIRLRDNMRAFKYLLQRKKNKLSEETIIEVANTINASSMYISDGYRRMGNHITDTDIPTSNPTNIAEDMNDLLNNYYSTWKDMDPYEREARFHIGFIRIHPFEDGNGRTSRLILNYNLLSQGLAPVIITDDLDEYYKSYIHDEDIDGMSNIFKIQSKREEEVFKEMYKQSFSNLTTEKDDISIKSK